MVGSEQQTYYLLLTADIDACFSISVYFKQEMSCNEEISKLKLVIASRDSAYQGLNRTTENLRSRLRQMNDAMRYVAPGYDASSLQSKDLPVIFVITPTYTRPAQKAELTRLAQTLVLVANIHWIVIEDRNDTSQLVAKLLKRLPHPYTHLSQPTPPTHKLTEEDPNWLKPRGVYQRNAALQWLRRNVVSTTTKGVVYFADDDNTYDVRLFSEVNSFFVLS